MLQFPGVKKILWDHTATAAPQCIHLAYYRNPALKVSEKVLRLVLRHLDNTRDPSFCCILTGSLSVDEDGQGCTVVLDRFDRGQTGPGQTGLCPSTPTPGDVHVPFQAFRSGKSRLLSSKENHLCAFKCLDHRCSSKDAIELGSFLLARGTCCSSVVHDVLMCHVDFDVVCPSTQFIATPVNPVPIVPTALSKNLAGPMSLHHLQGAPKTGYLTMDHTRKLLLVLESDPKVYSLPLVGIWVSGVSLVNNPFVWAACQRYISNSAMQDRVCSPPDAFLLVLYSSLHSSPEFYECMTRTGNSDLDFSLYSVSDSIQLPKNGSTGVSQLAEFNTTLVSKGQKIDPFSAALEAFRQLRPTKGKRQAVTEENPFLISMEEITPRAMPSPQPSQMPTIDTMVPEVSIMLQDTEKGMAHPSSVNIANQQPRPRNGMKLPGNPPTFSQPIPSQVLPHQTYSNRFSSNQLQAAPVASVRTVSASGSRQSLGPPHRAPGAPALAQSYQPRMYSANPQTGSIPSQPPRLASNSAKVTVYASQPQLTSASNYTAVPPQRHAVNGQHPASTRSLPQRPPQSVPTQHSHRPSQPRIVETPYSHVAPQSYPHQPIHPQSSAQPYSQAPMPQHYPQSSVSGQQYQCGATGQPYSHVPGQQPFSQAPGQHFHGQNPHYIAGPQTGAQNQPVNEYSRNYQQVSHAQPQYQTVPQPQPQPVQGQMVFSQPQVLSHVNALPTTQGSQSIQTRPAKIVHFLPAQQRPTQPYSQPPVNCVENPGPPPQPLAAVQPRSTAPAQVVCPQASISSNSAPSHPAVSEGSVPDGGVALPDQDSSSRSSQDSGLSVTPDRPTSRSADSVTTSPKVVRSQPSSPSLSQLTSSPGFSNVPPEVYQLLIHQDSQLKQLQAQIQELLRLQSPQSGPRNSSANSSGTKPSNMCSVAINTSLLDQSCRSQTAVQTSPAKKSETSSKVISPVKPIPKTPPCASGATTPSEVRHRGPPQMNSTARFDSGEMLMSGDLTTVMNSVGLDQPDDSIQSDVIVDLPSYQSSPTRSRASKDDLSDSPIASASMMGQQPETSDEEGENGESKEYYNQLMVNIHKLLHQNSGEVDGDQTSLTPPQTKLPDSQTTPPVASPEKSDYWQLTQDEDKLHSILRLGTSIGGLDTTFIPKINYVSMFLDSDSDTSMEINAMAMKYLKDEQLTQMSKLRTAACLSGVKHGKKAALLQQVLQAGTKSTPNVSQYGMSPNDLTFATKKYMEKYNLLGSSGCDPGPRPSPACPASQVSETTSAGSARRLTRPKSAQPTKSTSPLCQTASNGFHSELYESYINVISTVSSRHVSGDGSPTTPGSTNKLLEYRMRESIVRRTPVTSPKRTPIQHVSPQVGHIVEAPKGDLHTPKSAEHDPGDPELVGKSQLEIDNILDVRRLKQLPKLL